MKNLYKIITLIAIYFLFTGNIFAQTTKTIGAGGSYNYENFEEAINSINGIDDLDDDYIFEVMPGTYEGQITFPNISNTNNYKITFKKADGETDEVLITESQDVSSIDNFMVEIAGSNYYFENINFQRSDGIVIYFSGNSTVNNSFKNCKITGNTELDESDDEDDIGFSVISFDNSEPYSNITFENDTIIGGTYGFYLNSSSTAESINISNCTIESFYTTGIHIENTKYFSIERNNIIKTNTSEGLQEISGIFIQNESGEFSINANSIMLSEENNDITGINIGNISSIPESNYMISNNMILLDQTSNIATGIKLYSSYVEIINNTVLLKNGASESAALTMPGGTMYTDNIIANNILANKSTYGYAMNFTSEVPDFTFFENNDYYASSNILIGVNSGNTIFSDITAWIYQNDETNNSPIDVYSFSIDPNFTTSDLHINTEEYSPFESRGSINAYLEYDFDGEIRETPPDVGADEGDFTLLWVGDTYDYTTWKGEMFVGTDVKVVVGDLNIQAGSIIKFLADKKLTIEGSINAIGNENNPIIFTSENFDSKWKGIEHIGTNSSIYSYCTFENADKNTENGGAISLIYTNSNITINYSKFINNNAENGGAIYCEESQPILNGILFLGNTANNGGAIYIYNANTEYAPQITSSIFKDNFANTNGGAMFFNEISDTNERIYNNTFYNNDSQSLGKDIYLDINSDINIYNSIFWNNFTTDEVLIYSDITSSSSITNCIIKGGSTGTNITNTNTLLSNDPLFKNIDEMDFSVQPNSIAVDGGYYISDSYSMTDFLGNERVYNYQTIDIGAYELQAPRLAAITEIYYEEDCYNFRELSFVGYDPYGYYPYEFEWSVINNDQAYIYYEDYEGEGGYYFVNNLPPSIPVDIKLTVTDGTITEVDTVTITNTQPIVNAGEDISLINTDINNDIYSDATLSANLPMIGEEKGIWEEVSATGLTISDNTINNPTVSNIEYGVYEFTWTISKIADESCSNTDTLLIVAGHSFTSEPDGTFDWNTPSDWEEGAIPGIADSVTIYGVTGTVDDAGGVCDRLFIGNGTTLNIEGTAKTVSNLNCRVLTIEEDSEKFKNIKGSANLYIKDNASLNIGSEYVSKSSSTSGSGLFIGSGGTVFIRPNAEKDAKATAGLNIGSGGFIFIRPNAEKDVKATAGLSIGSGGFVFIRPNAEKKTSKTITTGDVFIGPGGYLNIEQTIDGTTGGYLELANDRTIYVSPSTAKAVGGNFGIYGGTVFIRPNAKKSSSNNYGVYCGRGGTIFIRPNAEKILAQANLITPGLLIEGGKVIVGTDSKSKAASGRLSFNQIFIRPNAEKDIIADTSLIIYPSGELVLSDSAYSEYPYIEIENSAVSFLEGSVIDLDNARATAHIYIKPNGSLIDMNPTASYKLLTEYAFEAGKTYLFSPSTQNTFVSNFGDNKMVNIWNEAINDWNEMADADMLNSGNSYLVTYPSDNALKYFYETTNNGDISVPLSFSDIGNIESEGWNSLGNPYPSAIDIEKLNIPTDAFNSFYIYNPDTETIGIYQKGGVSLNNTNQYLMQNEGFFIKTDAISNFTFDNNSRVHFTDDAKTAKTVNNLLKLRVSDIENSDETAILLNNDASDYIDKEFDAIKLKTETIDKPILYTKITGENAPIAINTLEYTTETTTIPLYFEASTSGQYTINVSDLIFDEGFTIKLKDIIANTEQDLSSNSSYNFDYTIGEDPHKFDIIISSTTNIEDLENEDNIDIFSNNSTIFINSKSENSKVEVYDLNGKLLLQKDIQNLGINSINVNLPQSIYIVKLITKDNSICKKVVISK